MLIERKKERKNIYFSSTMHTHVKATGYIVCTWMLIVYVALRIENTSTPCETFVRHTEGGCLSCLMLMLCAGRKVTGYGRRPCFNPETWWVQSQKTALNTSVMIINDKKCSQRGGRGRGGEGGGNTWMVHISRQYLQVETILKVCSIS